MTAAAPIVIGPPVVLADFLKGVDEGWPEEDVYRWIVCQLPRSFHGSRPAEQRAALAERVPLTGTKWDALLAAMVEHVAWLHGHERPAWVDEPERFLDATWVVADTPWTRLYSVIFAPDRVPAARGSTVCVDPLAVRSSSSCSRSCPRNWGSGARGHMCTCSAARR